ncbi:gag-pol polyprotein [Tanacetum coccineum]
MGKPFQKVPQLKKENRKWLNKAIDEDPYEFKNYTPPDSQTPRMQTEEVLTGDDLKHYEVEIEAMNLILISILNEIYNSVDACTTAKAMWERVERLMRGTVQNKVDRETHFNNEFDQFVAEPGEALVSIYNQDTYDDLFDYLQQFEKLVNASRVKKLEKSHDPLALVAHTGSSSRTSSPYYVTHPSLVVDYDDDYQRDALQSNYEDPLTSATMLLARAITQPYSNPTNNRLHTSSNTRNQAIMQADRINIQSRNSGNDGRNTRRSAANVQCYNCSEKGHYARNCPKPRVQDLKYFMEQIIQPANIDSDARPSYDSVFLSGVQTPSTSYVNPLFAKDNQEQKYLKRPKIINDIIGDDQIDSNIIFDAPNVDVNSCSVEYDNNVQASYALKQLALNAYGYQEKDKNNDKTGQNRAWDWKEREKTSSTVPSDFIGPARLCAASSVRRSLNRDSPLKNSVLSNTRKSSEKVEVSIRSK